MSSDENVSCQQANFSSGLHHSVTKGLLNGDVSVLKRVLQCDSESISRQTSHIVLLIFLHAAPVTGGGQSNVVSHSPGHWLLQNNLSSSSICSFCQVCPCDRDIFSMEVNGTISDTNNLATKHWHLNTSCVTMHGDDGFLVSWVFFLFCSNFKLSTIHKQNVFRLQFQLIHFLVKHQLASLDQQEGQDWCGCVQEDGLSLCDDNELSLQWSAQPSPGPDGGPPVNVVEGGSTHIIIGSISLVWNIHNHWSLNSSIVMLCQTFNFSGRLSNNHTGAAINIDFIAGVCES